MVLCSMEGFGSLEVPQLPAKPVPCAPAHFKSISEYSNGPLRTMKSVAWGPYLPMSQLREAKRKGRWTMIPGFFSLGDLI